MKYPQINSLTSDPTLNQVFRTYKIDFDIIGNKYEFNIQVCIGTNKEGNPYVDILDVMGIHLNGEKKEQKEHSLVLSNIHTMFGQEWYENIIREQALKDWEQISFEKGDEEKIDVDSLLGVVKDEINDFDFEDYLDTEVNDNSLKKEVTITSTINYRDVMTDLFDNIKKAIENR